MTKKKGTICMNIFFTYIAFVSISYLLGSDDVETSFKYTHNTHTIAKQTQTNKTCKIFVSQPQGTTLTPMKPLGKPDDSKVKTRTVVCYLVGSVFGPEKGQSAQLKKMIYAHQNKLTGLVFSCSSCCFFFCFFVLFFWRHQQHNDDTKGTGPEVPTCKQSGDRPCKYFFFTFIFGCFRNNCLAFSNYTRIKI